MSAEELRRLLTEFVPAGVALNKPLSAEVLAWNDLWAELLSRLSEVEELRKQVASITKASDDNHAKFVEADQAAEAAESKLAAAEAEAERLRSELQTLNEAWKEDLTQWGQEQAAANERLSKMEGALREAMPMIEFYAEREINHPANHQEFVREKREMLRELRAVLAESALSLPPSEEEPPQKETK